MDDGDEYAKLVRRMNSPRVVIDNDACGHATIIQVDTIHRHGTLLEIVQVLADLSLVIVKAYVCSDGDWIMNVFYVTCNHGDKIRDEDTINYIHKALGTDSYHKNSSSTSSEEHTSIELTGPDRPGLLSEVAAVLADLKCNVVNAEIWTHNAKAAAIVCITDHSTGQAIEGMERLSLIKELLCNVLKGNYDYREPTISISSTRATHSGRRLHQMMFAARDFERPESLKECNEATCVMVSDCADRDYTVVTVKSIDRPKLLFDSVCTLTDMQYAAFHGTVITVGKEAFQEFYIRHLDGLPIRSEAERQRVMDCLEAAIKRRASEGLELELSTDDRFGLLSDITRIFRENGLCIKQAVVSTKNGKAKGTFYITDVSGNAVQPKTICLIQQQVGQDMLKVKGHLSLSSKISLEAPRNFLFGSFFKGRSFQNFGLIKSS